MGSPEERAFVIRVDSTEEGAGLAGRLEHVVSGRAAGFRDLAELRDAVERILAAYGAGTCGPRPVLGPHPPEDPSGSLG